MIALNSGADTWRGVRQANMLAQQNATGGIGQVDPISAEEQNLSTDPAARRDWPAQPAGGSNPEKGAQSCISTFGTAAGTMVSAVATPGAGRMNGIVARVVISALLLPVFVALVVDVWRDQRLLLLGM